MMASTSETTTDIFPEGSDSNDEMQDIVFAQRGCCHWMLFAGRSKWERITNATPERKESWWSKSLNKFKKLREWSEIIAGSRWKTFIRRFNKNKVSSKSGKFQYDPLSYSLNFDDGTGQNDQFDDDHIYRDFSSRYATIPLSAKSSMDLRRDAPSFT